MVEAHRGLLVFGSYVTLRLPLLKYAVWSETNTYHGDKFSYSSGGKLKILNTQRRPAVVEYNQDTQDAAARNQHLAEKQSDLWRRH
jgi:hypothetical protein